MVLLQIDLINNSLLDVYQISNLPLLSHVKKSLVDDLVLSKCLGKQKVYIIIEEIKKTSGHDDYDNTKIQSLG